MIWYLREVFVNQTERTYLWVGTLVMSNLLSKHYLSATAHSIFLQPVDRRSFFQDTFKWCRWRNTEEERFGGAAEAFSASATKAPLLFGAAFFLSCDSAKGYVVVVNAEAELRKRQKLLFSSQLRRHLKKVASSREPGEEPPKVGVQTFRVFEISISNCKTNKFFFKGEK